jgi:hypothetical protein
MLRGRASKVHFDDEIRGTLGTHPAKITVIFELWEGMSGGPRWNVANEVSRPGFIRGLNTLRIDGYCDLVGDSNQPATHTHHKAGEGR